MTRVELLALMVATHYTLLRDELGDIDAVRGRAAMDPPTCCACVVPVRGTSARAVARSVAGSYQMFRDLEG